MMIDSDVQPEGMCASAEVQAIPSDKKVVMEDESREGKDSERMPAVSLHERSRIHRKTFSA
jgi:hypothetical protein